MDLNEKRKKSNKKSIKKIKNDIFPSLNFDQNDCLDKLCQIYKSQDKVSYDINKESNFTLFTKPFKCVQITNFINDSLFLTKLKDEILTKVEFFEKNNDLYQFKQSDDFKNLDFDLCNKITRFFKNDILQMLKKITGINLFENEIDITASKYEYCDTLLCHDDMLEERRIAFILYLVDENWSKNDGGTLDLICKDGNQQPSKIEIKLLPKFNSFVFFEVTPYSYHQVNEILSKEKVRLSVNGWFRGSKIYDLLCYKEKFILPIKCNDINVEEELFKDWINPIYLTDEIQAQVREEFQNESQISLSEFLNSEKFNQVEKLLKKENLNWQTKGPLNRRKYFYLNDDDVPELIKELTQVLRSEAFFLTLGNLTGLKLHSLNQDNDSSSSSDSEDEEYPIKRNKSIFDPKCNLEIRKWTKGCYTLIHDYDGDVLDKNAKLDVQIYFNHDFEADLESGGYVQYIEKDEPVDLLSVQPQSNHLSVVYRDKKTVRFVKYINCTHKKTFHDISLIFQE